MSVSSREGNADTLGAYGFISEPLGGSPDERTAWIRQRVKEGKTVATWNLKGDGRLLLFTSQAGADGQDLPEAGNFWRALDWFSEGAFDYLVCGDWFIHFPEKGREILEAIRRRSEKKGEPMSLTPPPSDDPFLNNQWGKLLSLEGKFGDAGRVFRESVERMPAYGEPYSNLGALLWNFGKRREALLLFSEALLKNPRRTSIQLNFFDAAHEMQEYRFMSKILEDAMRLAPDQTEFGHHLAICYQKTDRRAEACEILKEILHRDPADREARMLLEERAEAGA